VASNPFRHCRRNNHGTINRLLSRLQTKIVTLDNVTLDNVTLDPRGSTR
jgi:hypothetical protein